MTTLLLENQAIEWPIGRKPVSSWHPDCVTKGTTYLYNMLSLNTPLLKVITNPHVKMMKNKVRKVFPSMRTL